MSQELLQQAHFEEQPDGTVIPVDPSEKAQQEQPAQEKCWCDQNNIGEPEVSCGDCPTRDYKQPAQEPVVARPIGFDYLDSGQLIATYALPVEGKSHPKLYTHPAPPPPALSDLIELAKVYSQRYASPHHIVFSVDGLRHLIEAHLKGQK